LFSSCSIAEISLWLLKLNVNKMNCELMLTYDTPALRQTGSRNPTAPLPKGGGGYTVLPLSVCPSVQDIFRRIFLSNCWWQKSDIWSQASYKYTILWVAFLDPSDSYFLVSETFVNFFNNLINQSPVHKLKINNAWHQILKSKHFNTQQDELWANAHLWYPRSSANRK
jgi:hypothetical protein